MDKQRRLLILYTALFSLLAVAFFLFLENKRLFWQIAAMAQAHRLIAFLLVLSLYVFRAFFPFIPTFFLYTLTGRLIGGRFGALFLNFGGVILLNTLSYTAGRLRAKHPEKASSLRHKIEKHIPLYRKYREVRQSLAVKTAKTIAHGRFGSLLFLTLSPFPGQFLARIAGGANLPYPAFVSAAFLGTLPQVACATLLGRSLSDPHAPTFYLSLALTVTVTVLSAMLFQKSNQKEKR